MKNQEPLEFIPEGGNPDARDKTKIIPFIKPTDTKKNTLTPLFNGVGTNQLANISTRTKKPIVDAITGEGTITHQGLKVSIDKYNELARELRISTHKLFDALTLQLTKQNTYRGRADKIQRVVVLPIETYMQLCGIPPTKASKDRIRIKLKEDMETLFRISLEWQEPKRNKQPSFYKLRICDKIGIKGGNIEFSFTQEIAEYLVNSFITQYPLALMKLDERKINSYALGKVLARHNSMESNQRRGTANIISVEALLKYLPDIPTYEQIQASNRAAEARIQIPFENALDSLSFMLRWEYCNAKGVPLTEQQLHDTSYNNFIKLYIKFEIIDTKANETNS